MHLKKGTRNSCQKLYLKLQNLELWPLISNLQKNYGSRYESKRISLGIKSGRERPFVLQHHIDVAVQIHHMTEQ